MSQFFEKLYKNGAKKSLKIIARPVRLLETVYLSWCLSQAHRVLSNSVQKINSSKSLFLITQKRNVTLCERPVPPKNEESRSQ